MTSAIDGVLDRNRGYAERFGGGVACREGRHDSGWPCSRAWTAGCTYRGSWAWSWATRKSCGTPVGS